MTTQLIPLPDLINHYSVQHGVTPDDPRIMQAIQQKYTLVGPGFVVPHDILRPEGLVTHDARHHPRHLHYRVPHTQRALAHHWSRPGSIIAEWSALALHGLHDFSTGADTTLLGAFELLLAETHESPTLRRRRKHHTTTLLQMDGRPILVTDRMQTLAACLRSLRDKEHAWDTLASLKLDPVTVMSVQLIDLFCKSFGVTHSEIRTGLAKRFSARTLEKYLALSCPLAESRPETILRLLINEAVADLPGVRFESQVPVYTDGTVGEPGTQDKHRTLLTRWDIAERKLMVGVQYDGEHHLQRKQRDKDAEITADVTSLGWGQLRTSAGMLRKTGETKQRVRSAVLHALAREQAAS